VPVQITGFPLEVTELILIKAIAAFYARQRVCLNPRADVIALVTTSSVCCHWYMIINRSKRIRHVVTKALTNAKV
jgi:hypothetical protein